MSISPINTGGHGYVPPIQQRKIAEVPDIDPQAVVPPIPQAPQPDPPEETVGVVLSISPPGKSGLGGRPRDTSSDQTQEGTGRGEYKRRQAGNKDRPPEEPPEAPQTIDVLA